MICVAYKNIFADNSPLFLLKMSTNLSDTVGNGRENGMKVEDISIWITCEMNQMIEQNENNEVYIGRE